MSFYAIRENKILTKISEFTEQGSHTPFREWGRSYGIGKISGVLNKIGKLNTVLMYMYDVSIARLIPIIKLTFFLDNVIVSN